MHELDFSKILDDYVRVYKEMSLPAIICGKTLDVHWSNAAAQSLYPHLTAESGVRALLEEFEAADMFAKIRMEGIIRIDGALSLSGAHVNLVPIFCGGEVVGLVLLIVGEPSLISPSGVIEASKSPEALESSIRESVEDMFSAMDSLALKADILGSGWIKGSLNSIAQSGYHILRIASNISHYFRFQVDPPSKTSHSIDIFDLVRQSRPAVESLAVEFAIPVRYSLPDVPSFSSIDAKHFQIAFFNILHNSFYFTKEENIIDIVGEIDDNSVTLSIIDRGMGIPGDILDEVFRPYFSRGHDDKSPGVGLGLSIAKTIAEAAGGKIEIRSVLGEGTRASIVLPVGPLSRRVSFAQGTSTLDSADRFSSVYVGLCDAKASPYRSENTL